MYTRDTVHMKVIHTRKNERERKKTQREVATDIKKNESTYIQTDK